MKFALYVILAGFISTSSLAANYQPGDIILLPIDCFACKAIEKETGSPYAHSGLVVIENGEPIVLEAWSKVEKTPLKSFMKRAKVGVSPKLIRSKELNKKYKSNLEKSQLNDFLLSYFQKNMENLEYDKEYLWNNFDKNGKENFIAVK